MNKNSLQPNSIHVSYCKLYAKYYNWSEKTLNIFNMVNLPVSRQ